MSFLSGIPIIGQVADGLQQAWDDYTGKTATNMSAKAAEQNTQKQTEWERERATNAHQWEVQDLEKAGLNPILSAGGSGAATGGISPQLPDTSQYKGLGAIIPIISNMYDNILKNANSAKAMNEAKLANESVLTQKTQQLLNSYQSGLINKETALKGLEIVEQGINNAWLPWEKGVGIAKNVATSAMPLFLYGKGVKVLGNTATKLTKQLNSIRKSIKKSNWVPYGKGKLNVRTGELIESGSKRYRTLTR